MWLEEANGALSCNLCNAVLDLDGTRAIVAERARIRGWLIFEGVSLSGKVIITHICPECANVARIKPPEILEGQEELF